MRVLTNILVLQEELVAMAAASNLTLSYSSESSIETELQRESTADVLTIAVSYCCPFIPCLEICTFVHFMRLDSLLHLIKFLCFWRTAHILSIVSL